MKTETVEYSDRKILNVTLDNGNSWKAKEIFPDGSSIIFPFRHIEESGKFEARYKNIGSIKLGAGIEIKKGLYKNIKQGWPEQ